MTLTRVATISPKVKKKTYKECVMEHLAALDEVALNSESDIMLLIGHDARGSYYSVLDGDSVVSAIGLLEIIKLKILDEFTLPS